ncbi:hypothetical protein F0L74_10475 [Chitinophaga agrisoli]|uniref:Uncharacterized protein n=1 Tax=Chitinophaga agrisoli TaxID=2607653 RepID=A0A5B2VUL6_9BACT|nr:hypothetical protein [Chitinophaga agrisoli]KAA2242941.1 hypothetical protein F0L74_10475 [Chitinophaga agrisoli]
MILPGNGEPDAAPLIGTFIASEGGPGYGNFKFKLDDGRSISVSGATELQEAGGAATGGPGSPGAGHWDGQPADNPYAIFDDGGSLDDSLHSPLDESRLFWADSPSSSQAWGDHSFPLQSDLFAGAWSNDAAPPLPAHHSGWGIGPSSPPAPTPLSPPGNNPFFLPTPVSSPPLAGGPLPFPLRGPLSPGNGASFQPFDVGSFLTDNSHISWPPSGHVSPPRSPFLPSGDDDTSPPFSNTPTPVDESESYGPPPVPPSPVDSSYLFPPTGSPLFSTFGSPLLRGGWAPITPFNIGSSSANHRHLSRPAGSHVPSPLDALFPAGSGPVSPPFSSASTLVDDSEPNGPRPVPSLPLHYPSQPVGGGSFPPAPVSLYPLGNSHYLPPLPISSFPIAGSPFLPPAPTSTTTTTTTTSTSSTIVGDPSIPATPVTAAPDAADAQAGIQGPGLPAKRARLLFAAIQSRYNPTELIEKKALLEFGATVDGINDKTVKDAILALRKAGLLFPPFPGPTLGAVQNFSLNSQHIEVRRGKRGKAPANKSLTDYIDRLAGELGISGGNKHDTVQNTLIHLINSDPADKDLIQHRAELIRLFQDKSAAQYYTDSFVRAGSEHEQLITRLTAETVLRDLQHPETLPRDRSGRTVTHLDLQRATNVPTQWVVLKSTTSHDDQGGRVSQNHHPTSKKLISYADTQDSQKLHSSQGSGDGSSPHYHEELGRRIQRRQSLLALNTDLATVNHERLAGRDDILSIPASKRVRQTYQQTDGTTLRFDVEAELHTIARNVEVRKKKLLHLTRQVHESISDTPFPYQDTLPPRADSPTLMAALPGTPQHYSQFGDEEEEEEGKGKEKEKDDEGERD